MRDPGLSSAAPAASAADAVGSGEITASPPPAWWRRFFALDLLDNRYPALHGLRVLAIITVVQFHLTARMAEKAVPLGRRFIDGAVSIFFGMDLFFILSGFLIGSILLRSLQLAGTQNIRRFYLRRVFRTFPSYYVVLTLLVWTSTLTPQQHRHIVWEYLYATNFLPMQREEVLMGWGWSLALEEQFYLTVPLLFFVLHRMRSDRARICLLSALWLSALVVRLVIYLRWRPWDPIVLHRALYFRTYTRFDTLVLGILLAFVHSRYKSAIGAWLRDPSHRAMLALPSMACLWLLLRPGMFGPARVQTVNVFAWGTLTSMMYFPALLLLLHGESWIHRWLSAPVLRRVATLGYGVYLVHIPILDRAVLPAIQAVGRRVSLAVVWPASLVATMLCSLAVAYAMHVLIEKPSLWIRDRLAA